MQVKALEFLKKVLLTTSFAQLDLDHDGVVSEAELRAGFVGAGFDLPDECFADIISVLDTDGDGAISLKELSVLSGHVNEIAQLEAQLAKAELAQSKK